MKSSFLLFSDLPFAFDTDLPLDLGRGVYLDSPDAAKASLQEHDAELGYGSSSAMVLPEEVAEIQETHVCLRRNHGVSRSNDQARRDLWFALLALRLVHPFEYRTGGFLTIDDDGPPTIERLDYQSVGAPPGAGGFDAHVTNRAVSVNRRLGHLTGQGLDRIRSAVTLYSHCVMGQVTSWQLGFIGLVATLECIFPQPNSKAAPKLGHGKEDYGERLGRRISTFVPRGLQPQGLCEWISVNYSKFRNKLAHGYHNVPAADRTRMGSIIAYRKLSEITRLTLLGVLGKEDHELQTIWPISSQGITAQRRLEALGKAESRFLAGQKYWPPKQTPVDAMEGHS